MSTQQTAQFVNLTAEQAKQLLGFRTTAGEKEELPFRYRDGNGVNVKFTLDKNKTNRPLSITLAKRYAGMIFRGEFAGQWNNPASTCNGEPMIIDSLGNVVSMAHRGLGLIIAQADADWLRKSGHSELLEEYGVPEVITMPTLLVSGIDPLAADTVDTGKTRSLGDVYFRRTHFKDGKEISDSAKAALTRELAVATRLLWLRLNGQLVAGGGKFTLPEALAFSDTHPLIIDALLHVYNEDGGAGAEGRKISSYLSLGYAAALMYLMAFYDTPREKLEDGSLDLKKAPKSWKFAEQFWTFFSQFKNKSIAKDQAPAIAALHSVLDDNKRSQDKMSRDALCTLVCRAWLGWAGSEDERKTWATAAGLKKKLFRTEGTGENKKEYLDATRVGGFDLDQSVLLEHGWLKKEEKFVRLAANGWKKGDTCWVNQPNIEPWFGEIIKFNLKGTKACVRTSDKTDTYKPETVDGVLHTHLDCGDGVIVNEGEPMIYDTLVEWLCVEKPVRVPPAPPAAATPAGPPIKGVGTAPPVPPVAAAPSK